MQSSRPVNLNFLTMRFPITAIVSILHRISGLFIFLSLPVLLWVFELSLQSPISFYKLKELFSGFTAKLFMLGFSAAIIYHILAGVRHLLMDCHVGLSKHTASYSSCVVLALTFFLVTVLGVRIW